MMPTSYSRHEPDGGVGMCGYIIVDRGACVSRYTYMPCERVTIRRAALGNLVKGGIGKTSAEYYRIGMVAGVVQMGRE